MTTWWMDLKVIWWLLGLAVVAGGLVWRANHSERWLLDLDKRQRDLENWRAKAEEQISQLMERRR